MVIAWVIYALLLGFCFGWCACVWQEKKKLDAAYDEGYEEGRAVNRRKVRDSERHIDKLMQDNAWLRNQHITDKMLREGGLRLGSERDIQTRP